MVGMKILIKKFYIMTYLFIKSYFVSGGIYLKLAQYVICRNNSYRGTNTLKFLKVKSNPTNKEKLCRLIWEQINIIFHSREQNYAKSSPCKYSRTCFGDTSFQRYCAFYDTFSNQCSHAILWKADRFDWHPDNVGLLLKTGCIFYC